MDFVAKLLALAEQGDVEAQYKLASYMDPRDPAIYNGIKKNGSEAVRSEEHTSELQSL